MIEKILRYSSNILCTKMNFYVSNIVYSGIRRLAPVVSTANYIDSLLEKIKND